MERQLKMIRERVQDLVFVPRFNDDALNYTVLGSVNKRAEQIMALIDEILNELEEREN